MKSICAALPIAIALLSAAAEEAVLLDESHMEDWKMCGPGGFNVENGVVTSFGGMGLYWFAAREFDDFKLTVEFKLDENASNSGIFVRFPDPGNNPQVAVKQGYEVQIWENPPDNRDDRKTGAIYKFQAAQRAELKPAGQWNTCEITCYGPLYSVVLNGRLVNVFKGDRNLKGYVGIQNHDAKSIVHFRNIRVEDSISFSPESLKALQDAATLSALETKAKAQDAQEKKDTPTPQQKKSV